MFSYAIDSIRLLSKNVYENFCTISIYAYDRSLYCAQNEIAQYLKKNNLFVISIVTYYDFTTITAIYSFPDFFMYTGIPL
jgi:hypothetical protein